MVELPVVDVVKEPLAGSIVATDELLELHVPPLIASERVIDVPGHTGDDIVNGYGLVSTDIIAYTLSEDVEYRTEIVPVNTVAHKTPVTESMEIADVLTLHVPPGVALESVIHDPKHTADGPVIGPKVARVEKLNKLAMRKRYRCFIRLLLGVIIITLS